MNDLSIIIVNWNTRQLLHECLISIYRQTTGLSYEVIVVDNHSSDGSPDMVGQDFPQVHLIRNTENTGFSHANNQALRYASGRYLLLLNSDTAITENSFQPMADFMDAHPSVGIAGTRLLNPDGSHQYSYDAFPRKPLTMMWEKFIQILSLHGDGELNQSTPQKKVYENFFVDYVIGAVLLIRRETFEQIGMLDEKFFMYAEDIDWCYRAAQAGWQTAYLGTLSVYHYNQGSSKKSPEQSSRLQGMRTESLIKFYRKHYGWLNALLFRLILCLQALKGQ
ncbi:glycosyl transferase family 2 [candidate division KSB3 bacterium]|uniref:Glycosyl transferase family 2 n=1 Tax=candidate division KSB3 bacterium TaxID=2044937 RepID=A0A2G6KHU1_9BACT|nr:MAG: glycosyl transferase family 2 [candidate division KSB3 bacterium]